MSTYDLEILGVRLSVAGGGPGLRGRLEHALGAFRTDRPVREAVPTPVLEFPDDVPPDQAFARVFRTILDRIDRFVVLHAAALERDGRALLLSGPSGSGKTTLSLALLERGFRLLSDDFAPIERSTGLVHPFPKSPRIRPGVGVEFAANPVPRSERPLPPAAVVFFDGRREPPGAGEPMTMEVVVERGARDLGDRLAGIAGVTEVLCGEQEIRLAFAPAVGLSNAIEAVLSDAGDAVLEYGLVGAPPEPDAVPEIRPLPASAALVRLLREVQNRRPSGAFWSSIGGDPLRMATEVARLVGRLRFHWLAPGPPRETAALLAGLDLDL